MQQTPPQQTVGFVGLGIMGAAMAQNLLSAGHRLIVWNRSPEKCTPLVQQGAQSAPTPLEVAHHCETIFCCVRDDSAIREVVAGEQGLLANKGAKLRTIIDCSTVSPAVVVELSERARERNLSYLDAPVSGGDIGARNGTLTVMVGGERTAFDQCAHLFEPIAQSVFYIGSSGTGQIVKAANQIAVALSIAAMTEALHFAEHSGVDPRMVVEVLSRGAAVSWSFQNYAPRLLRQDYLPGFKAVDMLKDLKIALGAAEKRDLHLPAASLMTGLFEEFCEGNGRELGNHALIHAYRKKD